MGVGPGAGNGVDRDDGFARRFDRALENRLVMLFTAAVLAAGGSLGINSMTPQVRSDPATGAMLASAVANLSDQIQDVAQNVENRLDALEKEQALDNQHRIEAVAGYNRIRILEANTAREAQATEDLRQEVRLLREDMRAWLGAGP